MNPSTMNPFNNSDLSRQEKINVAPLLSGAKLITLLGKLATKGLLEWDSERNLAMVVKRILTREAGSTEKAQQFRAWLTSQGFRGSRRSRSFYPSLSDLESRGVTMKDGKAVECEPKVQAKAKAKANPFGDIMELTS